MSDSIDTARLEAFLNKALEAQEADAHSFPAEEEFRQIALRAGLSEEDWEKLSSTLEDHLNRGRNFLEFGNAKDAVKEFEEAHAIAPYRIDVIRDCGRAHALLWEKTGDRESFAIAERRFLHALELSPGDEVAAEGLSRLRNRAEEKKQKTASWKKPALVAGVALALAGVVAFLYSKPGSVVPGESFSPPELVIEAAEQGIPADASRLGDRAFKIFRYDIPWHEAKRLCEEMGGRLAVVKDQETLDYLNKMKGPARLWLGATDEEEEGVWKWVDGTLVEFDAWADKQPFNMAGLEHYMELGPGGGFNDIGVNGPTLKWRINGFICEWDVEENQEMRVATGAGES
jgi:tetratricopeptide (TPR) repeat protein